MNYSIDDYRDMTGARNLLSSNPLLIARIETIQNGDLIVILITTSKVKFPLCTQMRGDRKLKIRTFKTYDAALGAIRDIGFKNAAVVF